MLVGCKPSVSEGSTSADNFPAWDSGKTTSRATNLVIKTVPIICFSVALISIEPDRRRCATTWYYSRSPCLLRLRNENRHKVTEGGVWPHRPALYRHSVLRRTVTSHLSEAGGVQVYNTCRRLTLVSLIASASKRSSLGDYKSIAESLGSPRRCRRICSISRMITID